MRFFIGLPPLPAVLKEVRAADPLTSGSGKSPGGSWVGLDPRDQIYQIYDFQFPSFPIYVDAILKTNHRQRPQGVKIKWENS